MKAMERKRKWHRRRGADPAIVIGVKKYLAENVDKTYVDVGVMARTLRDRHREFANRPEHAFRRGVEDAYKVVLHDYGLDEAGSSSDEDDSDDDLEVLDDRNDRNALNDRISDMYDRTKRPKKTIDKNSELIDISSDDSTDRTDPSPSNPPQQPTPPPETAPAAEGTEERSSPASKKRKPSKRTAKPSETSPRTSRLSSVSLDDFGGLDAIADQICDLAMHMKHPEVYARLGMKAPRGALLHGPPGTGKTLLANALAGRLGIPIISVVATELVGGVSGESEKLIRETFDSAVELAPCVLFIDEIDAVCGSRVNAQKDMERRMVSQLLTSVDALAEKNASVLLLAATNDPDSLDPGLRRAGRLEQEIPLGIPTTSARKDILGILCRKLNLDQEVDLEHVARITPGFVGADLQALVNKSCTVAVKRAFERLKISTETDTSVTVPDDIPVVVENGTVVENHQNGESAVVPSSPSANVEVVAEEPKATEQIQEPVCEVVDGETTVIENAVVHDQTIENRPSTQTSNESCSDMLKKYLDETRSFTNEQLSEVKITQDDIAAALKTTKPCAFREGIITVPDTTWDDIGSLIDVRRDLQLAVLAPVKYPEQLSALGLSVPSGVLLCGPPGCGKTLLAKAVANEAGINFISVKGPELLNMYVGESERAVRTCFARARNSAPCVIFFDEFDSLCPKRVNGDIGGATRVVNQLLTEMDGVEGREGVFVLAATNRPDIIDPAVLRPGRLDRVLFVGMPLLEDRIDILQALTKKGTKPPMAADVDLKAIAEATENYTGADLAGLIRQAATEALTDFITGTLPAGEISVNANHFQTALEKTKPSVSAKDLQHYEKLRLKYTAAKNEKIDVEMDTAESMDTV